MRCDVMGRQRREMKEKKGRKRRAFKNESMMFHHKFQFEQYILLAQFTELSIQLCQQVHSINIMRTGCIMQVPIM